jgi:hypothetical protein
VSYSPTNIRSTACPNCNKFADKYIEHDGVVIAIDLLLLKPQAFRHMVFNVLSPDDKNDGLHPQTRRMWVLITLFDVYLTWAGAEKSQPLSALNQYILHQPVMVQYFIFLLYCVTDTFFVHLTIRLLARRWVGWDRPNALSTAVLISSSSKLFPILMLIWSYDIPFAAKVVGWAVNFNVAEVLTTILGCSYITAIAMTACAVMAKKIACDYVIAGALLWYSRV